MATARHRLEQLWQIDITSTGSAQQPDTNIANTDNIEFKNLAPFDVAITFTTTSGTVFNNIPDIPRNGGVSAPQSPQMMNVTVNYSIKNLSTNTSQGPYGIEVGSGPMQINLANETPDPPTISIPHGGKIQFDNEDSVSYDISWSPAGVFTPNVNPLVSGMNQMQTVAAGNQANSATYNLLIQTKIKGRGTVKINS
jgi:hypothetical protein